MSETEYEVDENGEVIEPTPDTEEEAAAEAEEEAAPEQEPEPEPEGMTEKEIEAMFKKIAAAYKVYTGKVGDGDGRRSREPPAVSGLRGRCAVVRGQAVGRPVPRRVRRQVMRFLGFATEQDYEPSQAHRVCGSCVGKGKVTTGSFVAGHETITCPACKGTGTCRRRPSEEDNGTDPSRRSRLHPIR